jgi:1-phosphofructokinase family hexose kinase
MIVSVTLNPCIDHVLVVNGLKMHDANRVTHVERDAGGKGVNLSRVVAELGGETIATGFLGGDTGLFVRSVLAHQGVQNSFVEVAGETRTNFSIEDGTRNPPTSLNGRGPEISPEELAEMLGWLEEVSTRCAWLAVGGSMPPGLPADTLKTIVEIGHRGGARVMLDADGESQKLGLLAKPDLIKPNGPETERLLGRPVQSDDECREAALQLYEMLGSEDKIAILSRGKDGATMACREGVFHGRSPEVEVRSTVGSGDSMLAAFLHSVESERPLTECLRWGLAAGAATAATGGAEIARRGVIESLLPQAQVFPA